MRKGLRSNCLVICSLVLATLFLFPTFSFAETDVTDKIELGKSRLTYDRRSGTNSLNVSLKNISQDVLLTPIKAVIDSISDSNVTVANADGMTADGKPYFLYGTEIDGAQLKPNATSSDKKWTFNNPNRLRFSYDVVVEALFLKTTIDRKSVLISASSGGTIAINEDESLYSQGFEIVIPPDALSVDTEIVIADAVADIPPAPAGFVPIGLPIVLKPEGLSFLKPVTIKIHYSDEELIYAGITDLSDLKLAYYNTSESQWEEVPVLDIDETNKLIVVEIDHFSFWNTFSWFENNNTDEDPATPEKIIDYVQTAWEVTDSTNIIHQVLYEESYFPFSSEIGGILTVQSMMASMGSEDYAAACRKGITWLTKFGLKASGYTSLAAFAGIASIEYTLLENFAHVLDRWAFNRQVHSYVTYWRPQYEQSGGMEQLIKDCENSEICDDNGWLLQDGTLIPHITGKLQPAHVYTAGEAIYQARKDETYFEADEQDIETEFKQAIEAYKESTKPSASFTISPSTKGNPPFTVELDPSESTAKNGAVITMYIWDFGDGTEQTTDNPDIVSHTFSMCDTYDIALTVEDSNGSISTTKESVIVTEEDFDNQAPVADFVVSLDTDNSLIVDFDASISNDPDGSIIYYEWSFGDGNLETGDHTSHTYATASEYTISLIVTDDKYKTTFIEKPVFAGDRDEDGIPDDGDQNGIEGDNPCTGGETANCDDNCPNTSNPGQEDTGGDGVGDVCEVDLNAGLVAYYPFNGNANDESGNGNDGIEYGGMGYVDGLIGQGADFDGTDDYVYVDIDTLQTIAVSLWFKTPEPEKYYPRLFDYGNDKELVCLIVGNHPTYIENGTVGRVSFHSNINDTTYNILSNTKPTYNEWHHLYAVFDKLANIQELYIDGLFEGKTSMTGELNVSTIKFGYGSAFDTPGDIAALPETYLKGVVDEVCIYNRPLSEAEIQALYIQGKELDLLDLNAIGAVATASSVYLVEFEADKAIDGDLSTRWNSSAHGTLQNPQGKDNGTGKDNEKIMGRCSKIAVDIGRQPH